jgi:hypothetical protein
VEQRRKEKADTYLRQTLLDLFFRRINLNTEGGQHIGAAAAAGNRAVAVFGDRDPGPRDDEGRGRGYVEGLFLIAPVISCTASPFIRSAVRKAAT